MRSHQIHSALANGINRFEVCQFVAKGVRATHRSGSRYEDSINDLLQYLVTHRMQAEALHPVSASQPASLKPAA